MAHHQSSPAQPTTAQLQLLLTLYKFRFATTFLIAHSYGSRYPRVIYARLAILAKHGYVGKRYSSKDRIDRKPAVYYLLPQAVRYLRTLDTTTDQALRATYNDRTATESFVQRWLTVFEAYVALKDDYGDQFDYYTRSELHGYDFLPQPRPDMLLRPTKPSKRHGSGYLLDYYDDTSQSFLQIQRLRNYITWADKEAWQKATDMDLPAILLVCQTTQRAKQLRRTMRRLLERTYADLTCMTTTLELLKQGGAVWQLLDEDAPLRRL
ncbi:MAG: replication-relaxation family protein [Candidatus Saccharibacteria bacterium]